MREIKFKALDKERKRILEVIAIDWDTNNIICLDTSSNKDIVLDFRDCEILEYIGHKDKNGVGLYDGDIIKFWYEENMFKDELIGVICWEPVGSCWEIDLPNYGFSLYLSSIDIDYSGFEKIGNICENSKLLYDNLEGE